jgi:RIP metalloprotease RseP
LTVAWVIAIGGIILLIILHELGHFAAAKAVGMRVERFSLFFPPTIFKVRRGETEYAIGAIPAGGYVKISGMSPEELADLDPEVVPRAYYSKKPWQRIVVILAGPGVNILIALVIFTGVLLSGSLGGANTIGNIAPQVNTLAAGTQVDEIVGNTPAYGKLRLFDRILEINGRKATYSVISSVIRGDRCNGAVESNCRAAAPLTLKVQRDQRIRSLVIYPRFEGSGGMMIGVSLNATKVAGLEPGDAAYGKLEIGDRIVTVDGNKATANGIINAIHAHKCTVAGVAGCHAATPVTLAVLRGATEHTFAIYPRFVKPSGAMTLGVSFAQPRPFGIVGAVGAAGATLWSITESTVTGFGHALTSSKARSHLTSIVGITQVTEQAVALGPAYGFVILGLVSMLLAVINLFPFLPLDGGHILWSAAEKVRGKRISTGAMWRFSSVGIILLAFLVVNAITNNVSRLAGGG